jgi:hypothetical protein
VGRADGGSRSGVSTPAKEAGRRLGAPVRNQGKRDRWVRRSGRVVHARENEGMRCGWVGGWAQTHSNAVKVIYGGKFPIDRSNGLI